MRLKKAPLQKPSSTESIQYWRILRWKMKPGWIRYPEKWCFPHHERKDGSGFPLKQKIKDIECTILQVCDALDCSLSGMECKRAGIQQTLEYLVETSDILYEKKVVKVIQKFIARYPVGTRVRLNTGETGIVITQSDNSIRPVIGILDKRDRLTDIRYDLNKNKKISILQVEE